MSKQLKFRDNAWSVKTIVDDVFIVASVYDQDDVEYWVIWHIPQDIVDRVGIDRVNFFHIEDRRVYDVISLKSSNDDNNATDDCEVLNLDKFFAGIS